MFCIRMDNADVKSFKLLPDNGGIYGADNNHVFVEREIIEHPDPKNMRVILNKDKHISKIISGNYVLDVDSGELEAKLIKRGKRRNKL